MPAISTAEAAKQAVQLFRQNVKYDDIAKHLEKIGYKSERTRKPLGAQAVRYMVMRHANETPPQCADAPKIAADAPKSGYSIYIPADHVETVDAKTIEAEADRPINVGGPKSDLLNALRTIVDLDLDNATQLGIVRALLREGGIGTVAVDDATRLLIMRALFTPATNLFAPISHAT